MQVGARAWLVVWMLAFAGPAMADDLAALLRRHDWPAAEQTAAALSDPLAPVLVRWLRLATPGGGGAAEIASFLAQQPGWPREPVLLRRYGEALAAERDDERARALCVQRPPAYPPALLRCAGLIPGGEALVRRAWVTGVRDAAGEVAVMRRWGQSIDEATQRDRFAELAWAESGAPSSALTRQAARLAPADRLMADARIALRRGDPTASTLLARLGPGDRTDPGVVLDELRWLRRGQAWEELATAWTERGSPAERTVAPERQAAFRAERQAAVRDLLGQGVLGQGLLGQGLLGQGRNELAYAIASLPGSASADADTLRGWIALRRLGRADEAALQFRAAIAESQSAAATARARYWLGRALAAGGDASAARAEYLEAAAWPTTYYGQLAALAVASDGSALSARLLPAADPTWDEDAALAVSGSPFGRAAALLVSWGEGNAAKSFLQAMATDANGERLAVLAAFANGLGLPDAAVALARRAETVGAMLPRAGWPDPVNAAGPERAVVLGVIRQESSFDPAAGSPVGAQGLMQLMPATAAEVARGLGAPAGPLSDPALNVRLGSAYLVGLVKRFGALPPALAAYNAGAARVRQWLAATGDPATGDVDPVDWIELIPFSETRGYVQQVIANVMVYRARGGESLLPHPVLGWAGSRS